MISFRKLCVLLTAAFLFSTPFIQAQAPTVTAQVGFPVGIRPASGVAFGNGNYVLLESYNHTAATNTVYHSGTGLAWAVTASNGLVTTQLNSMVFGAGLFVVAGNNGVIQTSADGVSWTTRNSGTANTINKIYYENTTFYAVGFNRTLLTSTNGINWTTVSFSVGVATDMFMSIAIGNGAYVIGARSSGPGPAAIVYRSTTGANNSWTVANNSPGIESINRIQFLNNKFFCFTSQNTMYSSTNGSTWTNFTSSVVLTQPNSTTTAWTSSHQIFHGVWDGAKYHFYGSSAYHQGYGSTFTSTDGVNLTLLSKTAYIVPQYSKIINGIYFVCGNEGVVTSTDGLTYQHPGSSLRDMVKTSGKYVAVGMISQDGEIYNSTDFTNWTARKPAGIKELYTAAYDGTRVLAGGKGVVLSSINDGDTWTSAYTNANETVSAMAYGNGRFVAGGYPNSGAPFLRYSTDGGVTWTSAANHDYYYIKIKYINNRFFAFAINNSDYLGRILYSADGISWTDVTPNLGYEVLYFKDVAFDGSKYHFWGVESSAYMPVNFFTVSTATPAVAASYGSRAVINNVPAGVTLGGVSEEGVLDYAGGKFTGSVIDVNTGQDYIIYSADGTAWTAMPQASTSSITAAYQSGQKVEMISRGNAYFTVSHSGTLAVGLSRFEGQLNAGVVKLKWSSATGQRNKQFVVQHSTDGSRWNVIDTVPASGTAFSSRSYHTTHLNPAQGANFYRLLIEDVNGATTQSAVVVIANLGKQMASCFPNPVTGQMTIRTSVNLPGQVVVYNVFGQAVKRTAITGFETVIPCAGLPAGTYVAEVLQGGNRQKIMVTKN